LTMDFLNRLGLGLANLGVKRLLALGLAGLVVFTLVTASAYYLSIPSREVLYNGLEPQDVTQIGAVLGESGISFDVSSDGKSVLVDYGHTANARMILAERGLPKGDKSGYELFDNLGSMGLTSFMQEVTKVRALEGELARTIQLMNGIKAARVHIVLPQAGTYRSIKEQPSASVMVRAEMNDGRAYAPAIQQLVAAAIPGMTRDMVTVLGTDGTVLASHGDPLLDGPETMVNLEKAMAKDIQERISITLTPFLGTDNFRVSVAAKLNTDKTQTNETKFDPDSRVERSVRTIKDLAETQNRNSQSNTSVDQNIPTEKSPISGGQLSSEKNDKKEEQTSYEINSKSTATISEGYKVEKLSIAILVNHSQIAKALGGSPTQEQIDKQLTELQAIASSAGGLDVSRGDKIELTAVDFIALDTEIQPIIAEGMMTILTKNLESLVNAFAMIGVVLLVLLLGLKPALRGILASSTEQSASNTMNLPMLNSMGANGSMPSLSSEGSDNAHQSMSDNLISEFSHEANGAAMARQKLEQLVSRDSEKAAKILKKWLAEPKENAA
jgi:flagellar M-ring protein FliF